MELLDKDKEYTLKELAQLLQVHKNTVYNWIRRGWLVGKKVAEPATDNPDGRGISWSFTQKAVGNLLYNLTKNDRAIK